MDEWLKVIRQEAALSLRTVTFQGLEFLVQTSS